MRSPFILLLALLMAAAIVGLGGARLARRERQDRAPANRAALRDLTVQWQAEIARLNARYEEDLAQAATQARADRPWALVQHCRGVAGVAGCALLPLVANPPPSERLSFERPDAGQSRLPAVWLVENENFDPKDDAAVVFSRAQLSSPPPEDPTAMGGWAKTRNRDFGVYWHHVRRGETVFLVVDWRVVSRYTNQHLLRWLQGPFNDARAADPLAAVQNEDNTPFAGHAAPDGRAPDVYMPVANRLGSWQIVSWDQLVTHTEYSARVLGTALGLSACLAALGAFVFVQQTRAQRLAAQRVSFVNRVSHEFGAPLTNMLLNLDLAAEAVAAQPEQARHRLSLVTEEVQRLARLVSNVLTFSRQERGALELAPASCVADEIIAGVLRQFEPALRRRGIAAEFQGQAPDGVLLDKDALAQIVGNLISNGEKYASEGRRLTLASRWENDWLCVNVRDYGPGIPAREQERIFEPFERLSSRVNEGASGTGLGLSIARDLARRMGGSLALLPSEGDGCLFEIRAPAPRVLAPVSEPVQSAA